MSSRKSGLVLHLHEHLGESKSFQVKLHQGTNIFSSFSANMGVFLHWPLQSYMEPVAVPLADIMATWYIHVHEATV